MTPEERLRVAAEIVRSYAAEATRGPWVRAADHELTAGSDDYRPNAVGFWDGEYAQQVTGGAWTGDGHQAEADARWIALASPTIAEPLVALLERMARIVEAAEETRIRPEYMPGVTEALALADAIIAACPPLDVESSR